MLIQDNDTSPHRTIEGNLYRRTGFRSKRQHELLTKAIEMAGMCRTTATVLDDKGYYHLYVMLEKKDDETTETGEGVSPDV